MTQIDYRTVLPGDPSFRGRGIEIAYAFDGDRLVAAHEGRVCFVGFVVDGDRDYPVAQMKKHFPHAAFRADKTALAAWKENGKTALELHGTPFQMTVWKALLAIPSGKTVCYQDIAKKIGRPAALRAVGTAVGANPVSLLVPCHRVVQKDGKTGNYLWGAAMKKKLLAAEAGNRVEDWT